MTSSTRHRATSTVYGYPRQGADRQLKKATEAYWAGRIGADALHSATRALRLQRLAELRTTGIGEIPSNDFSLYDHVLDTAWLLGAVPARHRDAVPDVDSAAGRLDRYFAMARGTASVAPLEMTKWFDTNYHYLVPELGPDSVFVLDATKPVSEFREAREAGVITRPVVLGPVSFLLLAKAIPTHVPGFEPLALLDRVLACYADLLHELCDAGAEWVQLDEPALVCDQPPAVLAHVERAYRALTAETARPKILVASYFDRLGDALPVLAGTPVEGLALDFTGPAAANLDALAAIGGLPGKRLVAGVVDGRNVWRTDLTCALGTWPRCSGWPSASTSPRPARCCTFRSTSPWSVTSTRRSRPGLPSPGRSWTNSSSSRGAGATGATGSPVSCRSTRRGPRRVPRRRSSGSTRCGNGSQPSPTPT